MQDDLFSIIYVKQVIKVMFHSETFMLTAEYYLGVEMTQCTILTIIIHYRHVQNVFTKSDKHLFMMQHVSQPTYKS